MQGSPSLLLVWTSNFVRLFEDSPPYRSRAAGPDAAVAPVPRRSVVAISGHTSSRRLLHDSAVPCSLAAATLKRSFSYMAAPRCSVLGRIGLVLKNTCDGGCSTIFDRTAAAAVPPAWPPAWTLPSQGQWSFHRPPRGGGGASLSSCDIRGFTPNPRSEAVTSGRQRSSRLGCEA